MREALGIAAGLLAVLAAVPYIRDILRGTTKPQRTSFMIWWLLSAVALASQLVAGGRASVILTAGDLLSALSIWLLSLKYGVGGWEAQDKYALTVAGIGVIISLWARQPVVALFGDIIADLAGVYLTFRKAYTDPGSETLSSWLLIGLGAVLGMFAVGRLSFVLLLYPGYLVAANLGIAGAILAGRLHKRILHAHLRS